ncbi:MAG: hypothetical protein ACTSXZ_09845 [Alphaproteobacteria bacterium]
MSRLRTAEKRLDKAIEALDGGIQARLADGEELQSDLTRQIDALRRDFAALKDAARTVNGRLEATVKRLSRLVKE